MSRKAVIAAVALAEQGVVWRGQALCPVCGKRMKVHTKRGEIRYCHCRVRGCLVYTLGLGVKAVSESRGSI